MKVLSESTSFGSLTKERASNFIGVNLRDIYTSFSKAKEDAYNVCLRKYLEDKEEHSAKNFRICSRNTFGFSVAWDREDGVRYITKDSDYLILKR